MHSIDNSKRLSIAKRESSSQKTGRMDSKKTGREHSPKILESSESDSLDKSNSSPSQSAANKSTGLTDFKSSNRRSIQNHKYKQSMTTAEKINNMILETATLPSKQPSTTIDPSSTSKRVMPQIQEVEVSE